LYAADRLAIKQKAAAENPQAQNNQKNMRVEIASSKMGARVETASSKE
jgi:hypothetical protein